MDQGSNQTRQGVVLLVIIVGVSAALVLTSPGVQVPPRQTGEWSREVRTEARRPTRYSMDQFVAVRTGQSEAEVFAIMGRQGTLLVDNEIAGIRGSIYQWQNPDGSNMTVQFQDGRAIQKAQYGLR